MPAVLVNQLMACHWIEKGIAIETAEDAAKDRAELARKIHEVHNRKLVFDF